MVLGYDFMPFMMENEGNETEDLVGVCISHTGGPIYQKHIVSINDALRKPGTIAERPFVWL